MTAPSSTGIHPGGPTAAAVTAAAAKPALQLAAANLEAVGPRLVQSLVGQLTISPEFIKSRPGGLPGFEPTTPGVSPGEPPDGAGRPAGGSHRTADGNSPRAAGRPHHHRYRRNQGLPSNKGERGVDPE